MKGALNALVEEAKSLLDSGRLGEALEASEIALEEESNSSLAWKWKGIALLGLDRYQEAFESLEHAVHLDPFDAESWNSQGDILLNLGRYEEAEKSYDQAMAIDPEYALFWIEKGVEKCPLDSEVWSYKGFALFALYYSR